MLSGMTASLGAQEIPAGTLPDAAYARARIIAAGEPAPADGVWLPADGFQATVRELRDLDRVRRERSLLEDQLTAERQNKLLLEEQVERERLWRMDALTIIDRQEKARSPVLDRYLTVGLGGVALGTVLTLWATNN